MKQLAPFIVMIALLIIIAVIIIALLKNRLKMRMIESSNIDDRLIEALTGPDAKPNAKMEILKWGLILFFGGTGLIVIEFLPFDSTQSSLPYGVEIVFIAAGFLSYYLLLQGKERK